MKQILLFFLLISFSGFISCRSKQISSHKEIVTQMVDSLWKDHYATQYSTERLDRWQEVTIAMEIYKDSTQKTQWHLHSTTHLSQHRQQIDSLLEKESLRQFQRQAQTQQEVIQKKPQRSGIRGWQALLFVVLIVFLWYRYKNNR